MTPKEFIRYTKKIDKRGFAICDGISDGSMTNAFDILYPLFIISGIGFFIWLLYKWTYLKNKIIKEDGDKK